MNWYLGTIGFAYQAWRDLFYPPWLESRKYLAEYSRIFNSVEIDSTFYGIPRPELVARWADQVDDGFQISPKTPKTITHEFHIEKSTADMLAFIDVLRGFDTNLGPILLQFPPQFATDYVETLDAFLAALPTDVRYAIEFRHASWWENDEAIDLLTKHHVAMVAAEYVHSPRKIIATTDFLYIRWIGEHGCFERGSAERLDVSDDLVWWQATIQPHLATVDDVFGYFNDDFGGHAPETCNQFKSLIGLPTRYPQFPKQGTLF